MKNIIDLRSDTVTKPTPAMLEAMFAARVGDMVFDEDPTVNELEEKTAAMLGKEAALFCPSGTMTNQIAIRAHTRPGEEVICDQRAHIYRYEAGGIAANSGVSVRLLDGDQGRFTAAQVQQNINPEDVHFPPTRLVVVENTVNRGGGSVWSLNEIAAISQVCLKHKLTLHLDGARLFNALVHTGEDAKEHAKYFDSISICLSKGLGAPVGSLLAGSNDFIFKARRMRKLFGGTMRQAGYLAAAGIYALDHHIGRLADDHHRAHELARCLTNLDYVAEVLPVETNILIFRLKPDFAPDLFLNRLKENNLLAIDMGSGLMRFVTHLDFNDLHLEDAVKILKSLRI